MNCPNCRSTRLSPVFSSRHAFDNPLFECCDCEYRFTQAEATAKAKAVTTTTGNTTEGDQK